MEQKERIEAIEKIIRSKWIEWYGEYPLEDFNENMGEIATAIEASIVLDEDLISSTICAHINSVYIGGGFIGNEDDIKNIHFSGKSCPQIAREISTNKSIIQIKGAR